MEDLKVKAMSGLVDVLDKWIQWLEQMPSYITDLVKRYWLFYWIGNTLIWILLLWVSIFIIKRIKNVYHNDDLYEEDKIWAYVALWFALFFAVLIWISSLYDGIKWFIVPELVLIDEFTWCSSC